jgi:DNA-binding PadR family transcriptional regulator
MEDKGLIKSRWVEKPGERRKRFCRLTPTGKKFLAEEVENWKRYAAAVNQIIGIDHA